MPRDGRDAVLSRHEANLCLHTSTREIEDSIDAYCKDLMNPAVIAILPETTVARAIDMLIEHGVSGLPVVTSDKQVLGIITEFALL